MAFIPRLLQRPSQSYFLFGPRGTGKSTWVKNCYPNATWIDLLLPDVFRSYLSRPERLSEVVAASPNAPVVIDEIQRVPSLLSVVHSLIEKQPNINFVLTGSSARKLKRTSADLLGGRALKRVMHPFIAKELGKEQFDLDNALNEGLLPLVFNAKNKQDVLHAYIHLYLQEEIFAEGLIRNLENFSRFLEVISFSHASLINISNIARECEVKRKTVENYITILEDLLLAYHLPVFSKRAQRELSAHAKFYLFDAGIFSALRPKGLLDRKEEINGAALEGLVAQHLKAWNDYTDGDHTLAFWRTRSGVEVDFIVYGPKGFWAIEVKNAKKVYSNDTKSLESFLKDYPMAKALLLYRGKEKIKTGNVLCLPCEDFLLQLTPNQKIN